MPVRKYVKTAIPAPPLVITKSSVEAPPGVSDVAYGSSKQKSHIKPRKGQGPTREELKKKEKEELMSRLKAAREVTAAKLRTTQSSPWKVTPTKIRTQSEDLQNDDVDPSDFLEINLTTSTEDYVNSQQKRPTYETFSDLPDNTSFCLSPASARSVSNNSRRSFSDAASSKRSRTPVSPGNKGLSQGWSPASTVCKSPDTDEPKSSGPLRSAGEGRRQLFSVEERAEESLVQDESRSSGPLRSKVDGRRQLFSVGKKSTEERLESLEAAVLSLEVLIRETSSKADVLLMNVGRVMRSLLPNEKRISKPANMPKLPLGTRQELNIFESFLGKSDENLSAVCDNMSSFIRHSVADPERKSSTSVLTHLLYNDLAKEMNLDGGNNKIGFRCLNLYKVFQGTLQTAFPKSDLSQAEHALRCWLKDAKWRKQLTVPTSSPKSKKKQSAVSASSPKSKKKTSGV